MGRAQGADDIDSRWVAFVADARAYGLEGVDAGQVALDQVGQFKVLEHEFEEFLLGDLEDELVHAFAGVTGLAAAPAACASPLGPGDMLAGSEFLVARVHHGLLATTPVVQHRFVDVPPGNADLFAMLHVGDGAAAHGLLDGLLDVVAVAPQKPLAVHRALVLAVQASVDYVAHDSSGDWMQPQASSFKLQERAATAAASHGAGTSPTPDDLQLAACRLPLYCDFLTRRYHSDSRRTCLSV